MKPHIHYIMTYATWSIGNGKNISFWDDRWLEHSIVDLWNIPPSMLKEIELEVGHFIVDGKWCLPPYIHQKYPALAARIQQTTLPEDDLPDNETDSLQVVSAYHKSIGVPWKMKARWYNCMKYCHNIVCSCVHVLRESNQVADALAKHGQGLS
jgi:hypothetical protein